VVVDSKGRGKSTGESGTIKRVKVKYPKVDKSTKLTAGTADKRMAKVDVTLSQAQMTARGFGTEGVDPQGAGPLNIQVAFVFAGVAYDALPPATLKVSRKKDTGILGFSRTGQ
jgi:hypothetical protein